MCASLDRLTKCFKESILNEYEKMCWNDKNKSSIEERLMAKQLLFTVPSVSQVEEGPKALGLSFTS